MSVQVEVVEFGDPLLKALPAGAAEVAGDLPAVGGEDRGGGGQRAEEGDVEQPEGVEFGEHHLQQVTPVAVVGQGGGGALQRAA